MFINLDENNYLLSVAKVGGGLEVDIDLTAYDLSGNRIRAHKWENDTLIFDAEKFAEIEAKKQNQEESEATPTALERLRADVDYIAIMTGVEL